MSQAYNATSLENRERCPWVQGLHWLDREFRARFSNLDLVSHFKNVVSIQNYSLVVECLGSICKTLDWIYRNPKLKEGKRVITYGAWTFQYCEFGFLYAQGTYWSNPVPTAETMYLLQKNYYKPGVAIEEWFPGMYKPVCNLQKCKAKPKRLR